jgi:signal transduction histidine kinase
MDTQLSSIKPDHKDHAESANAWFRWLWVWHALFFLIIMASTGFSLTEPLSSDQKGWILAFVTVLCGWYVLSIRWNHIRTNSLYKLAYLMMGWLVWFALTYISTAFMLLLCALFPHLFISLNLTWASLGAVFLTTLVILRQSSLSQDGLGTWLPLMAVATVAGIMLAYFIEAIIKESHARKNLIITLESTRRELAAAEREAGILQERQRLGREIHDTLAQGFISIITHLEAAEVARPTDAIAMQHHLHQAQTVARESLNEARRFVWELRPPALEKQPFETAVRQLVGDWSAAHRIPARVVITGACKPLSQDQETALVRVLQEALANVLKHAQAQQVIITISYMPDALIVDIHDDGIGFDTSRRIIKREGGFGLVNMRERIEQLHGKLTVESAVGEGTTIVAEIPLRA